MYKIYLIVACLSAVIVSTANAQPTPQRITKKVVKPQLKLSKNVSRSVVRSISSPRWNLNGSWSRVRNRTDLANHLIVTHKMDRTKLSPLSINQLWYLHDSSHDGTTTTRTTTTYCPPGST